MHRSEAALVSSLTALAAVLRFWGLGTQDYWLDELVTASLLELDLGPLLERIPDSESTPPLYYLVAWLWTQPLGTGEAALRSLSAVCGTAAVPVLYGAARTLVDRRAAAAAAALAATSPFLVWYSQEARSYGLLMLLSALSLWLLARSLANRRPLDLGLWALVAALALATHYFALFVVLPQAAWLAFALRRRAALPLASVALAGIALLPLAIAQKNAGFADFISDEDLLRRIALTFKQLALGYDSPAELLTAAAAVAAAVAGAVLAAMRLRDSRERGLLVAASVGIAGLVLPWLLALAGTDYVLSRNSIGAWMPLAVLIAAGLTWRRVGRTGLAAVVALCVLALCCTVGVQLEPDWQRGDWGKLLERP